LEKLTLVKETPAQKAVNNLYQEFYRRLNASPQGTCPVDLASAFVNLCHAQSCGKCVPCRIGLSQLCTLIRQVLDGEAEESTVDLIDKTADTIVQSADCAIGIEAARMVLSGVRGFREDYLSHVRTGNCLGRHENPVPCVALCPAGVDIPGYIALVHEGRCEEAVRLLQSGFSAFDLKSLRV